jgi:Fe-S oxidoreductase
VDWTFRSDGYEATNFGLFSGAVPWQKEFSLKLIHAAIQIGAKILVLPECGHAYPALRWLGANFYGKPLPFEVLHITEFLARLIREGKLKLKPYAKSVTFHDPCQVTRLGGAVNDSREILRALGVELREMEEHGTMNWCCGGGGGVVAMHRPDPLRYKVYKIKMDQVEKTGAEVFATSCSNCRLTLDDGQQHFHWDKKVHSLVEMVAENLEGQGPSARR